MTTEWNGWFGKGKVGYDQLTALKELINNLIQEKKLVNAQVVIDTEISILWITDDMCGVEPDLLPGVFMSGKSYPNGTLLSEHGNGMTIAVNWWGDRKSYSLMHAKTSIDGDDFHMVKLDRSQQIASLKPYPNCDPIQKYSVDKEEWVDVDTVGFQLKIKLHSPPVITTWFDNLVKGLEGAYWKYIGKNLNLDIIRLKKGKLHKHFKCKPINFIKTKNPTYGTIDKKRKLGKNKWDYDDIYICKKTGIIVQLKIGNVPHPDLVEKHYGKDIYNDYIESPYCYNGDMIGIHYAKAWVPISNSEFKASGRAESLVGFINIIKGIDTVQTKNDIVRPPDGKIEIFEEELEKEIFKKHGFRVRAKKTYHKISESKMEKDVLNLLKTNDRVRKIMGFDDLNHFDKKNTIVNGGVPDINCFEDKNELEYKAIIELKKEGGDRFWKAIVQGFAYCEGTKSSRLIIIGQDDDLKKEMWDKIKPIGRVMKIEVHYFQYQFLMSI